MPVRFFSSWAESREQTENPFFRVITSIISITTIRYEPLLLLPLFTWPNIFAILKPRNPSIDQCYVVQKRLGTDLEALKLWTDWSGMAALAQMLRHFRSYKKEPVRRFCCCSSYIITWSISRLLDPRMGEKEEIEENNFRSPPLFFVRLEGKESRSHIHIGWKTNNRSL